MEIIWISGFIVGLLGTWFIWRLFFNDKMGRRLSRALFKVGYFLYANTRCGRWLNDRDICKARLKFGEDGHSQIIAFTYGNLQIWPIPCMMDNYSYVIVDTKTNDVVIVDAGDGIAISQFLDKHSMTPKAILTTHKHWDHCAGNAYLKKQYPQLSIYGSAIDRPNGVTEFIDHERQFQVGSLKFIAYLTPGHTKGHLSYLLNGENQSSKQDCLFTGDLLFLAGSGKLFEGTAEEMLNSLDLICKMPDSTLIWPGHEYAVADLVFAHCWFDPDDVGLIREKLKWAQDKRLERLPTCPSTLAEEKKYNLFLRTDDVNLLRKLRTMTQEDSDGEDIAETEPRVVDQKSRVETLLKLRRSKDR